VELLVEGARFAAAIFGVEARIEEETMTRRRRVRGNCI